MAKFHRNASMIILLALLASGCLAPLSNSFTARSLGRGKIGLDGGTVALVRQEDSAAKVRPSRNAFRAFSVIMGRELTNVTRTLRTA